MKKILLALAISITVSGFSQYNVYSASNISAIRVTELNYHPADVDTTNDSEYEFIELKNTGDTELNLTGYAFINGIDYTFGEASVAAHSFVVLASNSEKFQELYGFAPFGEYSGKLDNGGERITFVSSSGDTILNFKYDDSSPWPVEADGLGYTLVSKSINGTGDPDSASYWAVSGQLRGSPGADDAVSDIKLLSGIVPSEYTLMQNYPNPFNPTTNIEFDIPQSGRVLLKIYDVTGREIVTLLDEEKIAGKYSVEFNASGLASGIYFCRIQVNSFSYVNKMVLLR